MWPPMLSEELTTLGFFWLGLRASLVREAALFKTAAGQRLSHFNIARTGGITTGSWWAAEEHMNSGDTQVRIRAEGGSRTQTSKVCWGG